jgi:hypothetical protein
MNINIITQNVKTLKANVILLNKLLLLVIDINDIIDLIHG